MRARDESLTSPLPSLLQVNGVERFLHVREQAAAPLRPGTESCVRWAEGRHGRQAKLCVVFLHGWSASPEEIDPVDANVASRLDAHLLRYRLTGHGLSPCERSGRAMRDLANSKSLRTDAATAFALGRLLGERPWAQSALSAVILISPAWQVAKFGVRTYNLMKWPLLLAPRPIAQLLLRGFAGKTIRHDVDHSSEPEHSRVWTHEYPSECGLNINVPVLAFANPKDPTVFFKATEAHVRQMPSSVLQKVENSENPHVITGRLKSPSTVPRVTEQITHFVQVTQI
ncbi:MAG: hypothetical protein SGPRY_003256 [Prymnesium sp.]